MPEDEKKPPVAKAIPRKPAEGDYEVVEDRQDDEEEEDRPRKRRRRRDDDEEEGDATGGLIPYKNAKALLAYYIGIFGFFLPLIGGCIAIWLGIGGLKYAKEHPKARGQAHAIIGILGGLFAVCFWLFIGVVVVIGITAKR